LGTEPAVRRLWDLETPQTKARRQVAIAMYDRDAKRYSSEKTAGGSASTKEAERRSGDRYTVTAAAEVIDLGSGARFSTRTTDLGPGGCFVDTLVPLPVGSKVRVSVQKDKSEFETGGVVVYSQPGLGMGIAFDTTKSGDGKELESWLAKLTDGKQFQHRIPARPGSEPASARSTDHAALVRLVRLMIEKRILTEAEGSSVLFDPLL
jgi:hypothetical protein